MRAFVELGGLSPDDVAVELVHGRANAGDVLSDVSGQELELESHDLGAPAVFLGTVPLDRSGSFGYTVRVVPRHPHSPRPPSWAWSRTHS